MVKEIPLQHGMVSLIDDEDFEKVSKLKWYAHKKKDHNTFYVRCTSGHRIKSIRLHSFILKPKKNKIIDHINGDGLDNRKCNLRYASTSQNGANRRKSLNRFSSNYKGVSYVKSKNLWHVSITKNWKHNFVGEFKTEIEGAKAYDRKAKQLFGKFARLNFPSVP